MTDEVMPATVAARIAPQRFTQDEVDERVSRAVQEVKPADYDEVKAAAASTSGLEHQIAQLEHEIATARLESLRVSVAARFGVTDEDRDILLTGTDEPTLLLQAERLGRSSRPTGNVARREGNAVQIGDNRADREMREYVNDLFGNDHY